MANLGITAQELKAIVARKKNEEQNRRLNLKFLAIWEARKYFKDAKPQLPELLKKRAEEEYTNLSIYEADSYRTTTWSNKHGDKYPNHLSEYFVEELTRLAQKWCAPRGLSAHRTGQLDSESRINSKRVYVSWL